MSVFAEECGTHAQRWIVNYHPHPASPIQLRVDKGCEAGFWRAAAVEGRPLLLTSCLHKPSTPHHLSAIVADDQSSEAELGVHTSIDSSHGLQMLSLCLFPER